MRKMDLRAAAAALVLLIAGAPAVGAADAGERRIGLERLGVMGSALYVAAHPDDENTAMLAWLAKGLKVRAGYLSLTRGSGGQNLIGTEQGAALGLLRTHELLAARAIDGAEQYFTRAVDFGYSKTASETLEVWGREAVLADIVWVIRSFRPDVVITRFPVDGGGGHGHHTASAILIAEAFTAAADPARFPDQLRLVKPWRATRLVWNAWRRQGDAAPPGTASLTVDLGAWDPHLGRSYAELAAEARTMHKSQGFGASPRRGSLPNLLEHVAGEPAARDLFDGVDLSWRRVAGGERVAALVERLVAAYRPERPQGSVPALVELLGVIEALPDEPLIERKRLEARELIRECAGLFLDATAEQPSVAPGGALKVTAVAIDRGGAGLELVRLEAPGATATGGPLPPNQQVTRELSLSIPADARPSEPYWLDGERRDGAWAVPALPLVGAARNPPALVVRAVVRVAGREVSYEVPVVQRWTDPVEGERWREVVIAPAVSVELEAETLLFPAAAPRPVTVRVRAESAATATVRLSAPAGWRVEPGAIAVELEAGQEKTIELRVTPPGTDSVGTLAASVDERPARGRVTVAHRHLPPLTLQPAAAARVVRLAVETPVRRVGYVMGAGDEVPAVLRQLGIAVTLLADQDLVAGDLDRYEAIVTGVRAFNTREVLARAAERLHAYVERGGTLVVQYNTVQGLLTPRLGPWPLPLSRERVSVERAPVTLLAPDHPLLRVPHAIGTADFNGWVQERGLYFAGEADPRYQALLEMADPGEPPARGALLVGRHGKGAYVYTGLSFFRQLPAGVPGAIRLFLNLLGGVRDA